MPPASGLLFMINYLLVVSRQGKIRLSKWYATIPSPTRTRILREVTQLVLSRRAKMCNFIEYKGRKVWIGPESPAAARNLNGTFFFGPQVIYRRYASLFFVAEVEYTDNELITLEIIHRYVEILDRYFGTVCELDIIFNFQKAYNLLDELVVSGEMVDSSMDTVLELMNQADFWQSEDKMRGILQEAALM